MTIEFDGGKIEPEEKTIYMHPDFYWSNVATSGLVERNGGSSEFLGLTLIVTSDEVRKTGQKDV